MPLLHGIISRCQSFGIRRYRTSEHRPRERSRWGRRRNNFALLLRLNGCWSYTAEFAKRLTQIFGLGTPRNLFQNLHHLLDIAPQDLIMAALNDHPGELPIVVVMNVVAQGH